MISQVLSAPKTKDPQGTSNKVHPGHDGGAALRGKLLHIKDQIKGLGLEIVSFPQSPH